MASARASAGARLAVPEAGRRGARSLTPGEVAWIAATPCALATIAAVLLLGPPLGHAFLGPGSETFWPQVDPAPEPVEHGRYLVALLGPAALASVVAASGRRRWSMAPAAVRVLVALTQALVSAVLVVCLAAQNNVLLSADTPAWPHTRYFTAATLVAAGALVPLSLILLRRRTVAARASRWLCETRARRSAGVAVAVLVTVGWLLTAINVDSSLGTTNPGVAGHILWSMDETFAILNGRTPLADFHAQYGQLWPYLAALTMSVAGASLGVYTIVMASASACALLAIYATFRRVVRSSLLALVLYLPFVATGFFMKLGPLDDRYGPASLFSLWPVRYGGPYLLAWLTARHVDGAAPRRTWPLFLAAGLVALNNPEFGLPALGATLVALACARWPGSRRMWIGLLAQATAGMLAAVALVSLLTLARSGTAPHFALLFEFSRLYGAGGWAMLPMPTIGLHVAFFVTFAAALVVAAVRMARRGGDPALTAMLAWSGVFGFGSGSYFVGRSHPEVLIDLFSPWALSLGLLLVVVARSLAARAWQRPTLPQLAVLFGFGLTLCSLAQTPTPWSQVARLRDRAETPIFKQPEALDLVAATTRPGERIAILIPLGHRVAYDLGRVNVSPYSSIEAMPTQEQLRDVIDGMRGEAARTLFIARRFTLSEEEQAIVSAGFAPRRANGDFVAYVDTRPRPSG